MTRVVLVGSFGLLGVFARWAIDAAAGRWLEIFPVGILAINVVGSALAGAFYVLGTEKAMWSPALSAGLLVGFCGGFTTFSAYSLQAALYFERADLLRGLAYLVGSPVLGLMGAVLGIAAARSLS